MEVEYYLNVGDNSIVLHVNGTLENFQAGIDEEHTETLLSGIKSLEAAQLSVMEENSSEFSERRHHMQVAFKLGAWKDCRADQITREIQDTTEHIACIQRKVVGFAAFDAAVFPGPSSLSTLKVLQRPGEEDQLIKDQVLPVSRTTGHLRTPMWLDMGDRESLDNMDNNRFEEDVPDIPEIAKVVSAPEIAEDDVYEFFIEEDVPAIQNIANVVSAPDDSQEDFHNFFIGEDVLTMLEPSKVQSVPNGLQDELYNSLREDVFAIPEPSEAAFAPMDLQDDVHNYDADDGTPAVPPLSQAMPTSTGFEDKNHTYFGDNDASAIPEFSKVVSGTKKTEHIHAHPTARFAKDSSAFPRLERSYPNLAIKCTRGKAPKMRRDPVGTAWGRIKKARRLAAHSLAKKPSKKGKEFP